MADSGQDTHRRAAGAVVLSQYRCKAPYLLIEDQYGHWCLPKGHIEPQESPVDAARREVFEETGIRSVMVRRIGQIDYRYWEAGLLISKTVIYFLALATDGALCPDRREVRQIKWVEGEAEQWKSGYGYKALIPIYNKAKHFAQPWLSQYC